jgi:frataxin
VTIDDRRFHTIADQTLVTLVTALDLALGDAFDIDLEGGILTVDLPGGGQYVINKNGALRQIWVSSPKSGGWHFDWHEVGEQWRSTRGAAITLSRLLAEELGAAAGRDLDL